MLSNTLKMSLLIFLPFISFEVFSLGISESYRGEVENKLTEIQETKKKEKDDIKKTATEALSSATSAKTEVINTKKLIQKGVHIEYSCFHKVKEPYGGSKEKLVARISSFHSLGKNIPYQFYKIINGKNAICRR